MDRTKLLAARFRAAGTCPYLATALYAMQMVPTERVPTLAVDARWRCYVNPDFVADTDIPELAGSVIHEVWHLLRGHHDRAAQLPERMPARTINIAQDCEINDDLCDADIPLPDGAVYPYTFGLPDGDLFENYLPELDHLDAGEYPDHDCGSGAVPGQRPWESAAGSLPGVDRMEAAALCQATAAAIVAHNTGRGEIPGGWLRWANRTRQPLVDWRKQLGGSLRAALAWAGGATDYTRTRPSRRASAFPGVALPRLARPVLSVAVVIDTSASMEEEILGLALGEVTGILRAVGVGSGRVTALTCDAEVHVLGDITGVAGIELRGGGGTDLTLGIDAAIALPARPQVVVVLTDGFTGWPLTPSSAKVIAVLIGEQAPAPPDWVETVVIDPRGRT
ncbi:VWA-like domain-containing protein [Nocardia sp. NPDC051750]|uniref:vWA domain-containing protein n=1 Tax=Nocardia sp. NPDC051750 TaxID=3364325 RepID=UPI00379F808E